VKLSCGPTASSISRCLLKKVAQTKRRIFSFHFASASS
jgi:hypothetical protein